jgi:glycosyltransferase involved in cell wall biosynthesis
MRNAIFYLTYNGLYNFTNGIGTQTQLLIAGLEALRERLAKTYGSIDLHVICPEPDANTWNYDHGFYQRQRDRIRRLGGQVHLIPYKQHADQDLWELSSWKSLCQNVAPLLREQTSAYERSLIICVDQPWLQTPYYLKTDGGLALQNQSDTLLVPYSTAFIRYEGTPDTAEIAWEQHGLEASQPGSRVALADICPSFTEHLNAHFRLPAPQFAPYTSSILAADPTFVLDDEAALQNTIQEYGVPIDADILLAFGRAAVIKGFEKLIPALAPLRDRIHFVLISVPYIGNDSHQQLYDQLLRQNGLRATHIKTFTRDLPRALCQWSRTKIVAVPSRYETFSNIPVEVALWAREKGPIVVASAAGGFIDQIETGITGFLTDTSSRQHLVQTLRLALDLSPEAHAAIRQRAYQRVVKLYDFNQNFPATLRWFWERRDEKEALMRSQAGDNGKM